ncbi:hypothetical protein Hanom_Chr10g00916211 [Helianthus anomalus]
MDGVNELDENGKIQTFWTQMRKNKPLDESRKTGQTSGTKRAFYSKTIDNNNDVVIYMKIYTIYV